MFIAIDASRLTTTKNPTGVEVYTQEIILGLLKYKKMPFPAGDTSTCRLPDFVDSKFILADTRIGAIPVSSTDKPESRLWHNAEIILYAPKPITDLPASNQKILPWPYKFWSQIRLGLELLIHPPAVFFSPSYVIPFLALLNCRIKKIVTIHDVAFVYLPDSYTKFQKWFLKITTRLAVKYAHKIIVPTETTKQDLIKHFNYPADKIEVTYFGIRNQKSEIRNQVVERKKQILFIGRIESKKNIGNLIAGFQIFNKKYPAYQLILAGKPGVGYKNIQYPCLAGGRAISNIQYLGYISPERKEELLEKSSCLVLISKYEGFGFPLLEAFAHNLPTLASNIPALKEIGSNACLFVDPDNIKDIAEGLEKIITDENLRYTLIAAGAERLKDFSWDKCVEETWAVLNEV